MWERGKLQTTVIYIVSLKRYKLKPESQKTLNLGLV